jgi:hypothetical protein
MRKTSSLRENTCQMLEDLNHNEEGTSCFYFGSRYLLELVKWYIFRELLGL